MSKRAKNTRGMEESILEEAFHLGHTPEKWGPVPTEDYYRRAMAWLRLFWTCWRQMERHVPAILERHPEMCKCDCSCMRHIGRPWGPLSLGPVLLGWTSPESPWLQRGEDGRLVHLFYALCGTAPICGGSLEVEMETGRTCLRTPASGLAVLPAHLRVPFRPVYEPWCHCGMSLMELAGHFLPHPPVVVQVISDSAQAEAHPRLAGLLPAVPGMETGDAVRVAAHLRTSLEFHNAARLLTLAESDGLQKADVGLACGGAHGDSALADALRGCCARHGFSCECGAPQAGAELPELLPGDPRVKSVRLTMRQGLAENEAALRRLVLDCAEVLHVAE